jgi:hypothetical protein
MNLRIVDESGNDQDYDAEFLPRLGERIVLGTGKPDKLRCYRVMDIEYRLDHPAGSQVRIRVKQELEGDIDHWPE